MPGKGTNLYGVTKQCSPHDDPFLTQVHLIDPDSHQPVDERVVDILRQEHRVVT